uniref:Uncharacterized protein n=1 Tax=Nelumbo nucifera TaxID=4432 RepID=A0A822XWE9_NELNU|nr:TPA_asm: hypothetical protein HUJ06_023191 [Nelumbo nucifera]
MSKGSSDFSCKETRLITPMSHIATIVQGQIHFVLCFNCNGSCKVNPDEGTNDGRPNRCPEREWIDHLSNVLVFLLF